MLACKTLKTKCMAVLQSARSYGTKLLVKTYKLFNYCNQLKLMIFRYNSTFFTLIYSTFNPSNASIYKIVEVTQWALRKCSQNTKLYHIRKNQQLRKEKNLSSVTYILQNKFNPYSWLLPVLSNCVVYYKHGCLRKATSWVASTIIIWILFLY